MYDPSQKFDTIRISIARDIRVWQKNQLYKDVKYICILYNNNAKKLLTKRQKKYWTISRGELAALNRRMPWANRLFLKNMKGKFLNFLHEVEKMISVISDQV